MTTQAPQKKRWYKQTKWNHELDVDRARTVFASKDVPPLEAEPVEGGTHSSVPPDRVNGTELPALAASVLPSPSAR